jgi:hypothetical protein
MRQQPPGAQAPHWRASIACCRPRQVAGCEPWAEDGWRALRLSGGVELLLVKPCTRCTVPDVDQGTGEAGREVGRALVAHR